MVSCATTRLTRSTGRAGSGEIGSAVRYRGAAEGGGRGGSGARGGSALDVAGVGPLRGVGGVLVRKVELRAQRVERRGFHRGQVEAFARVGVVPGLEAVAIDPRAISADAADPELPERGALGDVGRERRRHRELVGGVPRPAGDPGRRANHRGIRGVSRPPGHPAPAAATVCRPEGQRAIADVVGARQEGDDDVDAGAIVFGKQSANMRRGRVDTPEGGGSGRVRAVEAIVCVGTEGLGGGGVGVGVRGWGVGSREEAWVGG